MKNSLTSHSNYVERWQESWTCCGVGPSCPWWHFTNVIVFTRLFSFYRNFVRICVNSISSTHAALKINKMHFKVFDSWSGECPYIIHLHPSKEYLNIYNLYSKQLMRATLIWRNSRPRLCYYQDHEGPRPGPRSTCPRGRPPSWGRPSRPRCGRWCPSCGPCR